MKIKFFGLMLLAVVMVFALASCGGGATTTTTQPAGNTYTITFEGADVAAITVAENTAATAPAAPTKAGYTFAGWTYAGEAWDWENIVISDMTLTASWTAVEYALTLNLDGGVLTAPVTSYTVEGLTLPTPIKAGFAFGGWVDANGNPVANIAAGTTGALTLTATWNEQADFSVDFQNNAQKIHYCEPNGSTIATEYNQTYDGGAGKRSDATFNEVYAANAAFDTALIQIMKNLHNWHETITENGNRFLRVVQDPTIEKYAEFTKDQAYNVGLQFYPGSRLDVNDNVFTISFDFRQKNVGGFGINVYARGNGKNGYNQNRSNLVTIAEDGSLWINKDTINDAREAYTDGSDKLAETKIGQTTVGAWNTIKIVMTESEDGGYLVDIYCNGTKLTATALYLNDTMAWGAETNKYDQLMIFGGDKAGQTAIDNIPGYYNEYDFDNISINGSYVD